MIKLYGAIALVTGLAACSPNPVANTTQGGLGGAATGAAIGCLATIPIGCAPGAAVGAAVGGGVAAAGLPAASGAPAGHLLANVRAEGPSRRSPAFPCSSHAPPCGNTARRPRW